jgi:MFS family permease
MIVALSGGSVVVGQIVNKTGKYKYMMVGGLLVASLGILSLSTLNPQSTYLDLTWRMALTGIGLGMAMPIFSLAVQNALPQKDLGAASSSTQLFNSIGSTVGLAIMGGVMNGMLTEKLANVNNEPFVQMAQHQGMGAQVGAIDVNSIQGIRSPEAQAGITAPFAQLPPQAQQQALDSFQHFVGTLQGALAGSITHTFFIGALVMAIAFVASFALKELPLKHHKDVVPTTQA